MESANSSKLLDTMKEELKSIDHNNVWDIVELPEGYELGVNMFIRPSEIQMIMLEDTRPNSLPNVLPKRMALTTIRSFHQSLRTTLLELFWH